VARPKTYFEQVPLAVVKRILKEQAAQRKTALLRHRGTPTLSEEDLKYPEWQKPLQDLLLERDRERLREKIRAVETLIIKRHQELAGKSDAHLEREALPDALSNVRVLKVWTDRPKS